MERPRDTSKACRLIRVSKSSLDYQSVKDDSTLERKLRQLAQDNPMEGFWMSYYRLRNDGEKVNHKWLHWVNKKLGLPLRPKVKRRVPARQKDTLEVPTDQTGMKKKRDIEKIKMSAFKTY